MHPLINPLPSLFPGEKYEPVFLDNAYKVHMKLTIKTVGPDDFGSYKCVSKNSLGDTDGKIKIEREYQEWASCFGHLNVMCGFVVTILNHVVDNGLYGYYANNVHCNEKRDCTNTLC